MQLTEMINTSNIYRFRLSNGEFIIGQLTREGKDFLQIGTKEQKRVNFQWVNIHHVIRVEFLGRTLKEAQHAMGDITAHDPDGQGTIF